MKVVIIGGGVMGLMQARELAHKGCDVVVVDKGACGAEASWAGGGIVSPLYPWRYAEAVTALASWSQSYYPNLIESLEAESGIDPELTRHGLLMLSVQDQAKALEWASDNQYWLQQVEKEEIYRLEPDLRAGFSAALWMSQVASVRNPRLLKALKGSLALEPKVEIKESAAIVKIIQGKQRVAALETVHGERIEGDCYVLTTGAWTSTLLAESGVDIESIKVSPVKGQMIAFSAKPGLVNRVVLNGGQYVIPRRDGTVLAGSTIEASDFDKSTSVQAKEALADMAIDLFPDLATTPITQHWAGLRPSSPKAVPYIGQLPQCDNLFINAGHFRNGLVLAPASVRLMTSILCQEDAPFNAQPYQVLRD